MVTPIGIIRKMFLGINIASLRNYKIATIILALTRS